MTRALWAGVMQVAGIPLLVWWLLDAPTGDVRVPWWPVVVFIGYVLLVPRVQRLIRARRPHLEDQADQQIDWQRASRTLLTVSETGALSRDRGAHTAAGVLACRDIESVASNFAYAMGFFIACFVLPSWVWLALSAFMAVIAVSEFRSARRGWHYLKILRSGAHTT